MVCGAWLALGCVLSGCRSEPPGRVTVVAGPGPEDRATFAPVTAFAEYVELVAGRNELRITLASYETSCERYVAPEDDEALVTVTVLTPPEREPAPATYFFDKALPPEGLLEEPLVLPKAQIGRRSYLFEPGGSIRLTEVQLSPHGAIGGLLDLHFRGESGRPATRIEGSFSAALCRLSQAPER